MHLSIYGFNAVYHLFKINNYAFDKFSFVLADREVMD